MTTLDEARRRFGKPEPEPNPMDGLEAALDERLLVDDPEGEDPDEQILVCPSGFKVIIRPMRMVDEMELTRAAKNAGYSDHSKVMSRWLQKRTPIVDYGPYDRAELAADWRALLLADFNLILEATRDA